MPVTGPKINCHNEENGKEIGKKCNKISQYLADIFSLSLKHLSYINKNDNEYQSNI